jgi:hypothetical protein
MVAVTKSQSARPVFSIVVPAFNEERNLLLLHARIAAVMQSSASDGSWYLSMTVAATAHWR